VSDSGSSQLALRNGAPLDRAAFARTQLRFLVQLAYSGELAATRAYLGHRHSLRDRTERAEIGRIIRDEIRHRHTLLGMLGELGAAPIPARERKMNRVGRAVSWFCHVGGWFLPMYGAARLESQNIQEYELAARLAVAAGLPHFVEPFLEMAEVEWDHELYFRTKAMQRRLWRLVPKWPPPPPRPLIRGSFADFTKQLDAPGGWAVPIVRPPSLVR
jgi:rubrerythrin